MTSYVSNDEIYVKNQPYDQGSLINNRGTGGNPDKRNFSNVITGVVWVTIN